MYRVLTGLILFKLFFDNYMDEHLLVSPLGNKINNGHFEFVIALTEFPHARALEIV